MGLAGSLKDQVFPHGDFWVPPHPTTTAYNGQPLVSPIVEGRIFMRGGDGIYCYDLRRPEDRVKK